MQKLKGDKSNFGGGDDIYIYILYFIYIYIFQGKQIKGCGHRCMKILDHVMHCMHGEYI